MRIEQVLARIAEVEQSAFVNWELVDWHQIWAIALKNIKRLEKEGQEG